MKLSSCQSVVALGALGGLWRAVDATIVPVTGVHTGIDPATGTFPPRLRLQDLQKTGAQWDLYIQAMISFQSMPEDDELSYFALSGIHGRPYVAWNGVEQVEGAPVTGYCTHNEVLFAIWHRPLVAVFEQVLAQHVQEAAARYTGDLAATYRQAADAWRHPYWDWAADKALPDAVVQPNVTIRAAPDGHPVTLDNPLRRYRFHQFPLDAAFFPPDDDDDFHLASYPETLRCPDPATNTSSPGMADGNVAAVDLAAQVYRIYSRVADFASMSSTACDSTSFEQEHNEVHVAVGGLHPMGHFAHLGYSGFDPLFMMHHAAIDRHVALWQAIHYNASMFGARDSYATQAGQFATAPGTNITADSPLKPFYATAAAAVGGKEEGTFHTGNSARDIATFGYAYPELLDAQAAVEAAQGRRFNGSVMSAAPGNSKEMRDALSRAVTATVNRLYGPKAAAKTATTNVKRAQSQSVSLQPRTSKAYFVRIGIEKAGLPLPVVVKIFLGASLAGRLLLLTSPPCGRVHGEIGLQQALDEVDGLHADMPAEDFIRQNFRWEVTTFSGEPIQLPSSHDVTIQVREEDIQLPRSVEEFPVYSNVQVLENLGTE